jgi:hypothetical protein
MNTPTVVQTSKLARNTDGHVTKFSVDASDLGWAPGFVPPQVTLEARDGRRLALSLARADASGILYRSAREMYTLTVFND